MSSRSRSTKDTEGTSEDQYVLTVFLPLLAVAILICAGACYYMERRRKRRIKEGKVQVESNTEGNLDAAESVISAASSRRRHYLLPTQTTGRLVRTPSVRGTYSTYGGDPPPYEMRRGEPRSMSMRSKRDSYMDRMDMEYERSSGPPSVHSSSGGYGGRPLSRSRSMMDVRHESDSLRNGPGSMRRSISSNNLGRMNRYHNGENNHLADDLYESASRAGSVMSERKRNSPNHDDWEPDNRFADSRGHPSSVSSFPVNHSFDDSDTPRPRSSNLRRSMSQPNLARTTSSQSARTYPQGILKKIPLSDDGRASHTTNSSDSGIKDIYGETPLNTMSFDRRMGHGGSIGMENSSRPTSRAGSVAGYGARTLPAGYHQQPNYHTHNPNGVRTMPGGYNDANSIYSVSAAYHQHHPSQGSMHGSVNHGYSGSFDPYQPASYNGGNYWDGQQTAQNHQQPTHMGGFHGYGY